MCGFVFRRLVSQFPIDKSRILRDIFGADGFWNGTIRLVDKSCEIQISLVKGIIAKAQLLWLKGYLILSNHRMTFTGTNAEITLPCLLRGFLNFKSLARC